MPKHKKKNREGFAGPGKVMRGTRAHSMSVCVCVCVVGGGGIKVMRIHVVRG